MEALGRAGPGIKEPRGPIQQRTANLKVHFRLQAQTHRSRCHHCARTKLQGGSRAPEAHAVFPWLIFLQMIPGALLVPLPHPYCLRYLNIFCLFQCVQSEPVKTNKKLLSVPIVWDSFPARKMGVGFWGWADRGRGAKQKRTAALRMRRKPGRGCGDAFIQVGQALLSSLLWFWGDGEGPSQAGSLLCFTPNQTMGTARHPHGKAGQNPRIGPKEAELNLSTFFSQTHGSAILLLLTGQSGG